ncbi:MAG: R3H domain-containing nucleic acid-binding protein [Patescibacteria group bacterium]
MSSKLIKDIENKTNKLIELLGSKAKVKVSEKDDSFFVDLEADEETGLLIGRHGETINSIQAILALSLREALEEKKVFVNVGDWREKQEEKLNEIANQIYQRAIDTGEPQPVYNLSSSQRRIIHMALSEKKDVETESTGEGENRYLLVKPKKK